jgi:hypothetical protein
MRLAHLDAVWRSRQNAALRACLRNPASVRRMLVPLLSHILGILPYARKARTGSDGFIHVRRAGATIEISPRSSRAKSSDETANFFTTYNPSSTVRAVGEILAAVERVPGKVTLVGRGRAGLWCLLAGAVAPRVRALDIDAAGFDPARDADWTRYLPLPGLRQIDGLAPVFAALGSRPLRLRNASRNLIKEYRRFPAMRQKL